MNYDIYKLEFLGGVHFGRTNLEEGEYMFCADTLFSALFQEALKKGEGAAERLLNYCREDRLLLSDAFPYMGDTYYLPKPMKRINADNRRGDSKVKKAYKKLKYIPVEEIGNYLRGIYDVQTARDINDLGDFQMKVSASVRGEEETKPYRVGSYYYREKNGLYIIIGYAEKVHKELIEELMESLAFVGIGGKKTSGMGKFELKFGNIPKELQERLTKPGRSYMTLSLSLPGEEEMEEVLKNAEYILCKRSGFVDSDNYAQMQRRKRDLYVLKAGACVREKFKGDIYNVADGYGNHPVYRYAKPMFLGVDV